jgi:C4-dicarboxylate transporter/malic acid transport protein
MAPVNLTPAPAVAPPPTTSPSPSTSRRGRFGALAHVTPNWFASVMGTGIVANAAATLPLTSPWLHVLAVAVWTGATAWLAVLTVAFALHWAFFRDDARRHAAHPVTGQFYGAPAMGLLTVGAGAQLVGADLIGARVAWWMFVVLWGAGTAAGLLTSLLLPFQMITSHDHSRTTALPAWLMPIVPPMVSASTGALLIPHLPAGQARLTGLLACYAMFGLSLLVGLLTLAQIYGRLMHAGPPAVQAAPTVWIALGMIGQSITAANLLGAQATTALPAQTAAGLRVFGVLYGTVMTGFGALVFALATALTVHAGRRGLRFSLTWWSFTFPVGTCVTGTAALGRATGSSAVLGLSVGLFAVLAAAWATVTVRTVHALAAADAAALLPPPAPSR